MVTFQKVNTSSYLCAECGMADSPGVDGYAPGHHAGYLLCDACAMRAWKDEVSSRDLDNTEGGRGGETMGKRKRSGRIIAVRHHGTRRIAGTAWPIESYVTRETLPYRTRAWWHLAVEVCNGVATSGRNFGTRAAALAALAAL